MEKLHQITTIGQLIEQDGTPTGNSIIDAFTTWIKENRSNLVSDAAKALGIPQRLLSDTVRFFVGATALEVILRWRMNQALPLLKDASLSPEDVALRCHFTSQKYLESLIQKYYHTTLRAYRTGKARQDFAMTAEERRDVNQNAQKLRNHKAKE